MLFVVGRWTAAAPADGPAAPAAALALLAPGMTIRAAPALDVGVVAPPPGCTMGRFRLAAMAYRAYGYQREPDGHNLHESAPLHSAILH